MAEQYQPLNISTGSAQSAIQSTPNVTPALENLMQGISSGFIAADDIRRRISDGPLEAATRTQELADVQQIRPLQREAQTAQLQNIQAKQQFEAESLPILNDIKREQLKAEYNDVLQHGVPSSVIKIFNSTVPGLIPYDPDKLYDKKTGGQLNTSYALELIGKAMEKAEKLKLNAKFTGPVQQKATDASGAMTETTTIRNQLTGEAVGSPIVTETKEAPVGTNIKEAKSTRYNATAQVEEDVVQRYDPNTGQLVGEAIVVGTRPIKLTQEQANALQFSGRMAMNNQVIADLEQKGFDPTAITTTIQGFLPNRLQPEQRQSYIAARNNWVTAALRKESGAAISQGEYNNAYREYFPRDGDSPAVVKQKAALRDLAEENIRMSAGHGAAVSQAPATPASAGVAPTAGAAPAAADNIPTVQTPAEASGLPAHIQFFRTPTGSVKKNPNYRP